MTDAARYLIRSKLAHRIRGNERMKDDVSLLVR